MCVGPPIPKALHLKEISTSSVMVTVSPSLSDVGSIEECNISYVVRTDKMCESLGDVEHFICSDLNLYTEVYVFTVFGLSQAADGSLVKSNTLVQNSTDINNLGYCKSQLK